MAPSEAEGEGVASSAAAAVTARPPTARAPTATTAAADFAPKLRRVRDWLAGAEGVSACGAVASSAHQGPLGCIEGSWPSGTGAEEGFSFMP